MSSLPTRLVPPLMFLANLSEGHYETLRASLCDVQFFEDPDAVEAAATSGSPEENESAAAELASFLLAFVYRGSEDRPKYEEVFANLTQSSDLDLSSEQRETLSARLLEMAKSDALQLASRATHAERNRDRLVLSMGIDTDMRPLLGREGRIETIVPWHTLTITSRSKPDDELKNAEFVLDHEDLVELRKLVDIALEAQTSIQEQVGLQGIEVWRPYSVETEEEGKNNEH